MPSRTSWFLQGSAVSILTTIGWFSVWTKHSKFIDLSPATDTTFQSAFYRRYNPSSNPTTHDLCVRKIPLFKLKPELVEDAAKGGTKLVEGFCAGVWGSFGYTIQRLYLANKYKNNTTTAHQLWSKEQLLASTYDEGTEITDHFAVLSKTPSTILVRCGDSPLNKDVRPSDGLFEISATVDPAGFAEFRLKSVFYQGLGVSETGKPPMEGFILWAHRQYTKLWMESAVRNVMK